MEKVDMPMMNRAISKPASALKFDFVKENRKHLMKKDAQIAALTAPEALPATNVSDVGFVANWNTVSGRVYRLFRSAHADGDWNGAAQLLEISGDGQRRQFTNDSPDQAGFFRLTVENP